jgi:hypothetical protein
VLLFGGQAGFGTTLRAVCYLSPLRLLQMVCPVVGPLAFEAWHAVLMVGALRRTQRLGTGGAVVAAVTPIAIVLLLCCGLAVIFAGTILAAGGLLAPRTPAAGGG